MALDELLPGWNRHHAGIWSIARSEVDPAWPLAGAAAGDDAAAREMDGSRLRALDLAIKYLGKHEIAIQAGGNLGSGPTCWLPVYGFKHVLTFEPDQENLECLLANIGGLAEVTWPCCGPRRGRWVAGWLRDPKGRPGWHKVAIRHLIGRTDVAMMRDRRAAGRGREPDRARRRGLRAGGAEGGGATLARDRPVLILEDLHRSRFKSFRRLGGMAYGTSPGALQRWLRVRVRMVDSDQRTTESGFMLTKDDLRLNCHQLEQLRVACLQVRDHAGVDQPAIDGVIDVVEAMLQSCEELLEYDWSLINGNHLRSPSMRGSRWPSTT